MLGMIIDKKEYVYCNERILQFIVYTELYQDSIQENSNNIQVCLNTNFSIRINARNFYLVFVYESIKADDGFILIGSETRLTGCVTARADHLGSLVQVDHDGEDDKEGEYGEDGNDDGDDTAGVGDDKIRCVNCERV